METAILPTVVAQNLGYLADFIRAARKVAGDYSHSRPVEIVAGDAAPKEQGMGFCWRTRGGDLIRYPSAYSRKGRSNMIYCPSECRVVVGADWRPESW
jgi:hypothetical protein